MANQPTEAAEIEFAFLRGMDEEGTVVEMSIKAQPEYDGGMTKSAAQAPGFIHGV